jgi:hypothetical protein
MCLLFPGAFLFGPAPAQAQDVLDAVFANLNAPNQVCRNDGGGAFSCGGDSLPSLDVVLGDVDGDGRLDAVFADYFEPDRVCLGDGEGAFSCDMISPDAFTTGGVTLGDVNGDSFLDAIFVDSFFASQIDTPQPKRICLGDGRGAFTCRASSPDAFGSHDVTLGDVDGDGLPDVIFANLDQPNRVCFSDAGRGFTCQDMSPALGSSAVALGDVLAPVPAISAISSMESGALLGKGNGKEEDDCGDSEDRLTPELLNDSQAEFERLLGFLK